MEARSTRLVAVTTALALVLALAVPSVGFANAPSPKADGKHKAAGAGGGVTAQAPFAPDAFENDDSTGTAKPIQANSVHTVDSVDGVDSDFMYFSADATGQVFFIEGEILGGDSSFDMEIWVTDAAGNAVTTEDDSDYFPSYAAEGIFEAPHPGKYYVEVSAYDHNNYNGKYALHFGEGFIRRMAGANRYGTAAALSARFWDNAVTPSYGYFPKCMVVANGARYSDALAGGVLASAMDGQLLLTAPNALPSETAAEIERALSGNWYKDNSPVVYIVGGTDAVSMAVERAIGDVGVIDDVIRVGGSDRFSTARDVASMVDAGNMLGSRAFIVSGDSWADALSAGAAASNDYSALLFTTKNALPDVTASSIASLGVSDIVIVGGTGVVSAAVEASLAALPGVTTVTRVAGANRYETARQVAEFGLDGRFFSTGSIIVASGENFADAVAAGPFSWNMGSYDDSSDGGPGVPVLLTPRTSMSPALGTFLDAHGMSDLSYLLGGTGAISPAVVDQINDAAKIDIPR